jgi:hypothetical protein
LFYYHEAHEGHEERLMGCVDRGLSDFAGRPVGSVASLSKEMVSREAAKHAEEKIIS